MKAREEANFINGWRKVQNVFINETVIIDINDHHTYWKSQQQHTETPHVSQHNSLRYL
jgi:hypothetical protein